MSEDILEELGYLFDWNPPALHLAIGHEKYIRPEDEYVRQAAFYDMHLAPNLVCKRLVYVENLHRQLCQIVDTKIQEAHDRGVTFEPSTAYGFVDKGHREGAMRRRSNLIKSKQSLVAYYTTVTSDSCLPVASSLALHPQTWNTVITWDADPQCDALGSYAGSLHMIGLDRVEANFGPEGIDPGMMDQLKKIATKYQDLATWEITTLSVEDTNAMLGVLTMATTSGEGQFMWRSCTGSPYVPECHDVPKALRSIQTCDAVETLLIVETSLADVEPSRGERTTHESVESVLDASLRRGGSSLEAVHNDILDKQRPESVSAVSWSETGSEAESKTESKAGSDAAEEKQTPWTPPGAGHAASQKLIQKAWGQSVRQNTTLLILNAGNYEYVCIRHRESQTLYISDVLHVPLLKDPGYGKIQVAIYITALQDALRRIALDSIEGGESTPVGVAGRSAPEVVAGSGWTTNAAKTPAAKRLSRGRGRPKKRQRTIDGLEEWSTQQAISRQFLLVHLHYDIYDTGEPELFIRAPADNSGDEDTQHASTPIPESAVSQDTSLLLFLNSELGQGNTGVVHGGVLEIQTEDKRSRLPIAAKFSFSDEQRERLQCEWSALVHLTTQGVKGIPTLLGIFHNPKVATGPLCLLTRHVGVSLRKSRSLITSAQRDAFMEILRSIHMAGVHHGDLRYENLLIDASGEVAIIDFDQATIYGGERARREEYQKLARLLKPKVDDSIREEAKPEGSSRARAKERDTVDLPTLGRVTRSMGTARQTSGGMTLRPRR